MSIFCDYFLAGYLYNTSVLQIVCLYYLSNVRRDVSLELVYIFKEITYKAKIFMVRKGFTWFYNIRRCVCQLKESFENLQVKTFLENEWRNGK